MAGEQEQRTQDQDARLAETGLAETGLSDAGPPRTEVPGSDVSRSTDAAGDLHVDTDADGRPMSPFMRAAIEAEYATGRREETEKQARRGVFKRIARIIGGFVLIGVGIAALVLPGPGWVMIIVGLTILPFAWTENLIRTIRRKVPGIPEDGRISPVTWVVMGVLVVGATLIGIFFGPEIIDWVGDLWSAIWD